MKRVISLSGSTGAGKDEAANIILEYLKGRGVQACKLSFAEALYDEISEAYGVTKDVLRERAYKETPQEYLALKNCADSHFVHVALPYLSRMRGREVRLDDPLSPREVLKTWGNGYRRESQYGNPNYFVDLVSSPIQTRKNWVFVVSDTRQDNEFMMFDPAETVFLRINRSDMNEDDINLVKNGHPTDTQWRLRDYDDVIENPFNEIGAFKARILSSVEFLLRQSIHQQKSLAPCNM